MQGCSEFSRVGSLTSPMESSLSPPPFMLVSGKPSEPVANTRHDTEWPDFDSESPFWLKFFGNCDYAISDPDALTNESACLTWSGPRASYNVSQSMEHNEPRLLKKTNASPLFYFGGKAYSARNVIYASLYKFKTGNILVKNGKEKRAFLRLVSQCGNISCVNPAHHRHRNETFSGSIITKSEARRNTHKRLPFSLAGKK